MDKNTPIIIAFILFITIGISVLSFSGLGFMLIDGDYGGWKIFWTIITFLVAAGIAYYVYRKIRR